MYTCLIFSVYYIFIIFFFSLGYNPRQRGYDWDIIIYCYNVLRYFLIQIFIINTYEYIINNNDKCSYVCCSSCIAPSLYIYFIG